MKLNLRINHLSALLTGLTLFFSIYGCQEGGVKQEARPSVTRENIQTAYAKAVKHSRMYGLFVEQAKKDHNKNVASLFRTIAMSESIRAANHAKLLRSEGAEPSVPPAEAVTVGTTLQTLKMAMSSEDVQFERMYPELIRTALLEKDTAAAEQFTRAKGVDERHRELFNEAIYKSAKLPKTDYLICPSCGFVFTSDKTDECPICHATKEVFVRI